MTELAKRAVACKGWRWMPGMRCLDGSRVLLVAEDFDGLYEAWCDEDLVAALDAEDLKDGT